MSNAEITKDILVALIGNQHTTMFGNDVNTAKQIAESYEIIFNKVKELNK